MFESLKLTEMKVSFISLLFTVTVSIFPANLRAEQLASDNPRAISLYREGLDLAEEENFVQALEKFRLALTADSNFIQAHLRYMDAFRSVDRGKEVIEMYSNKVKQHPRSALYRFLYGRSINDLAAKRAEFRTALEIDSTFYWAQFGIGGSYLVERRFDEAIMGLNKALDLSPDMLDALLLLGTVYLEKGMPFQARRQFEQALELDPQMAEIYLRLGQTYSQLERYETAEIAFRKAAALDPDKPLIYYYIGLACELGHSDERSLNAYRKFLYLDPEHKLAPAVRKNIEKLTKKMGKKR